MFSHWHPDAVTTFNRIGTAADTILYASPGHYLFAAQQLDGAAKLVKACELSLGQYVWTLDNTSQTGVVHSRIISLGSELGRGLYNPHTVSGSIVVDGVAVTTFTDTLPASMAAHTAVTLPARILYHVLCTSALRERVN